MNEDQNATYGTEEEQKFGCGQCNKMFLTKSGLYTHCLFLCEKDKYDDVKNEDVEQVTLYSSLLHPLVPFISSLSDDDICKDVTIVCGEGDQVRCHGSVLFAMASDPFKNIMENNIDISDETLIIIPDLNKDDLVSLFKLLYFGESTEFTHGLQFITEVVFGITNLNSEQTDQLLNKRPKVKSEAVDYNIVINDEDDAVEIVNGFDEESNANYEEAVRVPDDGKINDNSSISHSCDFCNISNFSIKKLELHVRNYHYENFTEFQMKYRKFKCLYCPNTFLSKSYRRSHVNKTHKKRYRDDAQIAHPLIHEGNVKKSREKSREKTCPECGIVFRGLKELKGHINTHGIGQNVWNCNVCEFKCSSERKLQNHIKDIHEDPTEVLCPDCGAHFTNRLEFKKHKKTKHSQKKIKAEAIPGMLYVCELCAKICKNEFTLKYHVDSVHPKDDKIIHCDHCGKKFVSLASMRTHRLLHFDPTFQCNFCEKKLHTKRYLKNHIINNHTSNENKAYRCSHCGKGFIDSEALDGHINMHLGLKPYKCRYCQNGYQNLSNCLAHEKKTHTDLYIKRTKSLGGVRVKDRDEGRVKVDPESLDVHRAMKMARDQDGNATDMLIERR